MPFCELKWPNHNGLEGQGQCLPFSIPVAKIPRCIFGVNLVILAQIHSKLSHGQAKIPSHYLNQCWNIVNWTLGNKVQWNFKQNSNIFIQENALEDVICEMASILSRPQWVKNIGQDQRWFHMILPCMLVLYAMNQFRNVHQRPWQSVPWFSSFIFNKLGRYRWRSKGITHDSPSYYMVVIICATYTQIWKTSILTFRYYRTESYKQRYKQTNKKTDKQAEPTNLPLNVLQHVTLRLIGCLDIHWILVL